MIRKMALVLIAIALIAAWLEPAVAAGYPPWAERAFHPPGP